MAQKAQNKLRQNKALRRRWLTWLRMTRYGANNFTRNAWLTTAATAVMTITLLIVFSTFIARSSLSETVAELRTKNDIPIFLKSDVTNATVKTLQQKLYSTDKVSSVSYISSDQARKEFIDSQSQEGGTAADLQSLSEVDASIAYPASLLVALSDPESVKDIEKLVTSDQQFKDNLNQYTKTTFAGKRFETINTINGWTRTAERAGLIAGLLFVAISMLIVFNTIRMAIFNRKEEIQMMKLIGADKGFIRGPFVVEAVMYGFIAALLATSLGYFGLVTLEGRIANTGIAISAVKDMMIVFAPLVLLVMIAAGGLIGVISSRLAVRRYLKV
jgi:cell division transport system permease protein